MTSLNSATGEHASEGAAACHHHDYRLYSTTATSHPTLGGTITYVFSHRSLRNPRRFAKCLEAAKAHCAAQNSPLRSSPRFSPPPPPSLHRQRWCRRCPYVLPFAFAQPPTLSAAGDHDNPARGTNACRTPCSAESKAQEEPHASSAAPTSTQEPFFTSAVTPQQHSSSVDTATRTAVKASTTDTLSTRTSLLLIRDIQLQLSRLQACVDGMQIAGTLPPAATASHTSTLYDAAAAVRMHDATSSDIEPLPDCEVTMGWASATSMPAALSSHNTAKLAEGEVAAAATVTDVVDGTGGNKPVEAVSAETQVSLRVSGTPPATSALTHDAIARPRECPLDVMRNKEGERQMDFVTCEVATPSAASTPLSTASAHRRHSNNNNRDIRSTGGLPRYLSDQSALSASALPSQTTDAASAMHALDRQLERLSQRRSWIEAVEAAGRHAFVEGDDGRPVTALQHRMVLVASSATSPLQTYPSSPMHATAQARREEQEKVAGGAATHPTAAAAACVAEPSAVNRADPYGMLSEYMWHLKSPREEKDLADVAGATGEAGAVETSLLIASGTSTASPSLATTMTLYVMPGEDHELLLTSLVSCEETKNVNTLQHTATPPASHSAEEGVPEDQREDVREQQQQAQQPLPVGTVAPLGVGLEEAERQGRIALVGARAEMAEVLSNVRDVGARPRTSYQRFRTVMSRAASSNPGVRAARVKDADLQGAAAATATAPTALAGGAPKIATAQEDIRQSPAVIANAVKPLMVVPSTATEATDDAAAVGSAAHCGSNNGQTRRSATVSTGDLSAPSGLSSTRLVGRSFRDARGDGAASVEGPSPAHVPQPTPTPPPTSSSSTSTGARLMQLPVIPGELPEGLTQHGANGCNSNDRRRFSESSWCTESIYSPTRALARPGAPSPTTTPHCSVSVSWASAASPSPPAATEAATSAPQDTSPPPCPPPPSRATQRAKAPTLSPVLPALAAARPSTANVISSKLNSMRLAPQPHRPSSTDSPLTWVGGTSVLTTGQYRVWRSRGAYQATPPLRVMSASSSDGFRRPSPLPFSRSAGAPRTAARPFSSSSSSSPVRFASP